MRRQIISLLKSPAFVAWVAIVVSVGQALINLPVLKSYYYVPKLTISPLERDMGILSAGKFQMKNSGNYVARDIEIGLELPPGGYIQLIPAFEHELQCDEKVVALRACRLKVERLPAKESVMVFIHRGERGTEEQQKHMKILESLGITIPRIEYAMFGDGHLATYPEGKMNLIDVMGEVQR